MKHIESRPSKASKKDYDFYVDIDEDITKEADVKLVVDDLKEKAKSVVVHHEESGNFRLYINWQLLRSESDFSCNFLWFMSCLQFLSDVIESTKYIHFQARRSFFSAIKLPWIIQIKF